MTRSSRVSSVSVSIVHVVDEGVGSSIQLVMISVSSIKLVMARVPSIKLVTTTVLSTQLV